MRLVPGDSVLVLFLHLDSSLDMGKLGLSVANLLESDEHPEIILENLFILHLSPPLFELLHLLVPLVQLLIGNSISCALLLNPCTQIS
jgi:hypothetical protein